MDVCCDKCQTEYELDEAKLRPGGVTVKCTQCGHMFKVRKRHQTQRGAAVASPPPAPQAKPRRTPTAEVPGEVAGERTWLIRLADGEILTCSELATLQKWIVAGRVSRRCEISRTGKKWKRLGEIGELASFFDIADEAREVADGQRPPSAKRVSAEGSGPQAAPRSPSAGGAPPRASARPLTGGHPRTVRRHTTSAPPPPPAPAQKRAVGSTPQPSSASQRPLKESRDKAPREPPASPPSASDPSPSNPPPSNPPPSNPPPSNPSPSVPSPDANPSPPDDELRTTDRWAGKHGPPPAEELGPIGGLARGVPTDDVAFAPGSKKKAPHLEIKGEFEGGRFIASDLDSDLKPASSLARWIVIASLVIIAGAGAFVFFVVLRDDEASAEKSTPAVADAGAELAVAESDAAPTGEIGLDPAEALAGAADAIRADAVEGLELAAAALDDLPGADPSAEEPSPEALVARAQVEAALGQHLLDQAAKGDGDARELERRAAERAKTARDLAEKALALDPQDAGAMVALADAFRLQSRPAREIERWLRRALRTDPALEEALLSRALLLFRDERLREARKLLERLAKEAEPGDVRARYRLALLELSDADYEAAEEQVTAVIDAQPKHGGAADLRRRIEEATEVEESDPMPPEVEDEGQGGAEAGGVDSYDRLLARADKLATTGNCSAAKGLYERALDVNPSGVAALTGLGYCHIDAREFSSAHAKFRAALGISSRYQPALWGMAEMYQQQGLKKEAIEAYRRFIREHPSSRRAEAAERQIERLGGTVEEGGQAGGGAEGAVDPDSGGTGTGSGTGGVEDKALSGDDGESAAGGIDEDEE